MMIIKIENQQQKFNLNTRVESVSFDVVKNKFKSKIILTNTYETQIFKYNNFSVFWCIVYKNNQQKVRFVMFNQQKRASNVIYEVNLCDVLMFKCVDENHFILITQNKKISAMHICEINQEEKINYVICLGEVKKICILKKQKILVHSIKNKFEEIKIFNLNGEVHSCLLKQNILIANRVVCRIINNELFVFDVNKKILYRNSVDEIIKSN